MNTKTYPETIYVAQYAHVTDDEIARDIADVEREIDQYRRLKVAEQEIARSHPLATERCAADFKARARDGQITEREAFVAFLRRLQSARAGASSSTGDQP